MQTASMADLPQIISEATKTIDIQCLKDKQLEPITAFVNGQDTFISLPTSYGKSIVYATLPFIFDKIRGKNTIKLNALSMNADLLYRISCKHCCLC